MPAPRKMRLPYQSLPEPAFQMSLSPEAVATLSRVSTGTITTVLLKKGLRNVWMRGAKPLRPGTAAAGRTGLYAALRARARRPGDAGILVVADFDPHRD